MKHKASKGPLVVEVASLTLLKYLRNLKELCCKATVHKLLCQYQ